MRIKDLLAIDVALLVVAVLAAGMSVRVANALVEAGLFTGYGSSRLVTLPASSGLGLAATNILTIVGLMVVIDVIIYACKAVDWSTRNNSQERQ